VVDLHPANEGITESAEGALGAPRSYSFVSVAGLPKEKKYFFKKAWRIKKRLYICSRFGRQGERKEVKKFIDIL